MLDWPVDFFFVLLDGNSGCTCVADSWRWRVVGNETKETVGDSLQETSSRRFEVTVSTEIKLPMILSFLILWSPVEAVCNARRNRKLCSLPTECADTVYVISKASMGHVREQL